MEIAPFLGAVDQTDVHLGASDAAGMSRKLCCSQVLPREGRPKLQTVNKATLLSLSFCDPLQIGPARFRAPELLFRPDLIGEECEGLHEVLVFAIQKSDMDLRRTLFSNIVLSGGSTLFKGSYLSSFSRL